MKKIKEKEEIYPNVWKTVYKGRGGVYEVKVHLNENYFIKSECDCGSLFMPCKHINSVKNNILRRKKLEKFICFFKQPLDFNLFSVPNWTVLQTLSTPKVE